MMEVRFFDQPYILYFYNQHKIKKEKNVTIQRWPLTYSRLIGETIILIRKVKNEN